MFKDKLPDEEKAWLNLLRDYGWSHTDELDLYLGEYIDVGYYSTEKLNVLLSEAEPDVKQSIKQKELESAWNLLRGFDLNEEEFVKTLTTAFDRNIEHVSINDLSNMVDILRKLDRDNIANDAIDSFIEQNSSKAHLFDVSNYAFRDEVKDQQLITKFNEAYSQLHHTNTFNDTLLSITQKNGYTNKELDIVSGGSVDDYYNAFKNFDPALVRNAVNWCLHFRGIINASEQMSKIASNATEALIRIGKEGRINRIRVSWVLPNEDLQRIPD